MREGREIGEENETENIKPRERRPPIYTSSAEYLWGYDSAIRGIGGADDGGVQRGVTIDVVDWWRNSFCSGFWMLKKSEAVRLGNRFQTLHPFLLIELPVHGNSVKFGLQSEVL